MQQAHALSSKNPISPPSLLKRGLNAISSANPFKRSSKAALSTNLNGLNEQEQKPLSDPYKPRSGSGHNRLIQPGVGINGLLGVGGLNSFGFGAGQLLNEIGKFNPLYVLPFHQYLMRRSVFPRLALTILKASLTQRQYVVEGCDPGAERFHQEWIDRVLPQILRKATNAIWFGWQPFVIDWEFTSEGMWRPKEFFDVDIFSTQALRDGDTGRYVGLATNDGRFGLDRAFWLTWNEEQKDPYGEGQSITVYPHWWSAAFCQNWMMKYFERSVDPVRIAFAKNISVFNGLVDGATGEKLKSDLTEVVADAMSSVTGGGSVAMPIGESSDGDIEELVRIQSLDLPDRSDQWMSVLSYHEQRQFLGTLTLPGIGLSEGQTNHASDRVTEKTQLSLLEFISDIPLEAINDRLIPNVHRLNGFKGPPPRAKGKAFKREQVETLREMIKPILNETAPEIGKDGRPTGRHYKVMDLIRPSMLLKGLDIAGFDVEEVARNLDEIVRPAPGDGGRPQNPQGNRADDRNSGLER